MKAAPRVSVVIPTYNAAHFLPQTLKSVFEQSFKDFEVVVVDDGSTDGTEQVLSEFGDPRLRLIVQHNQGSASARNTGIKATEGDYIAFLDADDLWEPSKLEKQVACLDSHPEVGLVHTAIRYIDEQGNSLDRELKVHLKNGDVWDDLLVRRGVRCGSTPMIRRVCFDTVGLFDPDLTFGEDWEMYLRVAARYHFASVNEPLVLYRQHGTNKSKGYKAILPDFTEILERAFQTFPERRARLERPAYAYAYLFAAWYAFNAGDVKEATSLHRQAVQKYPSLLLVKNSIHLGLKLAKTRLSGLSRQTRLGDSR